MSRATSGPTRRSGDGVSSTVCLKRELSRGAVVFDAARPSLTACGPTPSRCSGRLNGRVEISPRRRRLRGVTFPEIVTFRQQLRCRP